MAKIHGDSIQHGDFRYFLKEESRGPVARSDFKSGGGCQQSLVGSTPILFRHFSRVVGLYGSSECGMTLEEFSASLPGDLLYAPQSDLWVRPGQDLWTVGANAFVVHYGRFMIFYPKPDGLQFAPQDSLGVMETWKTAFAIEAPFAGRLTRSNLAAAEDIERVRSSPYEQGWLFEVCPADTEAAREGLLGLSQYREWLATHGQHQFAHLMPEKNLVPYDPLTGV
ncbi:MAG: hypothetical protein FJY35_00440 [Betaproteobacteria bacterium]|nr:hypothetical protein [Betaproteobacteria bacterium]